MAFHPWDERMYPPGHLQREMERELERRLQEERARMTTVRGQYYNGAISTGTISQVIKQTEENKPNLLLLLT